MSKTAIEQAIDANRELEIALDKYMNTIQGLRNKEPEIIELWFAGLRSTADSAKRNIKDLTDKRLKEAQSDYTPDTGYTNEKQAYIDAYVKSLPKIFQH